MRSRLVGSLRPLLCSTTLQGQCRHAVFVFKKTNKLSKKSYTTYPGIISGVSTSRLTWKRGCCLWKNSLLINKGRESKREGWQRRTLEREMLSLKKVNQTDWIYQVRDQCFNPNSWTRIADTSFTVPEFPQRPAAPSTPPQLEIIETNASNLDE